MRGGDAVLQKIGETRAVAVEAELRAGPELCQELTGPANIEIELHLDDIATAALRLAIVLMSSSLSISSSRTCLNRIWSCFDIASFEFIFSSASRVLSFRPMI